MRSISLLIRIYLLFPPPPPKKTKKKKEKKKKNSIVKKNKEVTVQSSFENILWRITYCLFIATGGIYSQSMACH